jgi:hypothetical protein
MCAAASAAAGEEMIGTVWAPDGLALVETPLPWSPNPREQFGSAATAALRRAWDRGFKAGMLAIAPDDACSRPAATRVLWYRHPLGAMSSYTKQEYVVPRGKAGALVASLLDGAGDGRWAAFRDDHEGRDLLVCTHGTVDACCGKFGFPAYRLMREAAACTEGVRVWRASHFGGHRFAPTVLDMPEGRYWGRLDDRAMEAVVRRCSPPGVLYHHYRGWAGAPEHMAIVERELLMRFGWRWTRFIIDAEIVGHDAVTGRSEVRVAYRDTQGADEGVFLATVVRTGLVELSGCGLAAGHEAAQYRVMHLTRQTGHMALTAVAGAAGKV